MLQLSQPSSEEVDQSYQQVPTVQQQRSLQDNQAHHIYIEIRTA